MRGIKISSLNLETLEALVLIMNSVIFMGLGVTILRLSDVANLFIERIKAVAPDYVQYIGYGYLIGYLLLFFAILHMFLSALKLYDAKASKRVEVKLEVKENAPK